MQYARQLLPLPTRQVDCNFRPEVRVAAVKHQPVDSAHLRLHIQR